VASAEKCSAVKTRGEIDVAEGCDEEGELEDRERSKPTERFTFWVPLFASSLMYLKEICSMSRKSGRLPLELPKKQREYRPDGNFRGLAV